MKRPWKPRSECRLNLMGISSVGPEEQHPVILGADVNKATLIMCGKDAQYSTGFLQNKIILHAIESFCLFVLFINQECTELGNRIDQSSTNNLSPFYTVGFLKSLHVIYTNIEIIRSIIRLPDRHHKLYCIHGY